jgi:hypothetical protein
MKKTVTIFILMMFASKSFSQDLIITTENDSINCKITKMDYTYIYFSFLQNNKVQTTLIPKTQVKQLVYNFYSHSEVPAVKTGKDKNYPKFRISLGGGFSYRTASISPDLDPAFIDYMKKLKLGFNLYADGTGYFNRFLGLGGSFKWFRSANSMHDLIEIDPATGTIINKGTLSDKINILYIAPMLSVRFLNKSRRHALHLNASIGWMGYWDDAVFFEPYQMQANTVGVTFEIGYDVRITDDLLIGFQFSTIAGTFSSYTLTQGGYSYIVTMPEKQKEGLGRIDLTIGLCFSQMPTPPIQTLVF